MLYVFLVDTGAMLTFEMELAMESVETLMKTITSMLMIPTEKQVLIIQGGKALEPSHRICNYSSAGTESNPIFLFSKTTIESSMPPSPSLNLGSETSLREEVELSLKLPPTYETLVSRALLALRFQDMASELLQSCVSLVNEQNLQREGWLAVIANLENIASTFQNRGAILEQTYAEFVEIIPQYISLLDNFQEVILLLSKILVFPCLIRNDVKTLISKDKDITLLDWINAQDKRNSLEDMVQQCVNALEQIQKVSLLDIKREGDQILEDVSNTNMKEIGGLEERLSMLSRLCENARILTQEQSDMAQGFSQNQIRAQNIGDPSVLPDLCSSHQKQLSLLMNNHSKLRDIRRRCAMAKDELSGNLHARLRWVMMIEKRICDCDNKLVLYHESMKRIKKRVEILEQIKIAPEVYTLILKEVVRRRDFTSQYMEWAKSVTHYSQEVYDEEVARRHEFSEFVGHHFLQNLFSGIDDTPTLFAQTAPELFDIDLPPVTSEEIRKLIAEVPELLTPHTETYDVQKCLTTHERSAASIRFKSFSADDLPRIKQSVVETSIDGMDTSGETSLSQGDVNKPKYGENKDHIRTCLVNERSCKEFSKPMRTTESANIDGVEAADLLSLKNKNIEGEDFTTKASCSRIKNVNKDRSTEQQDSSCSKTTLSDVLLKQNVDVNLSKIRAELRQLALDTTSWRKDFEEFFCQRMRVFEELTARGRSEKRAEETTRSVGESGVEKWTEDMTTLTKKVGSLGAENESLRKELKAKEEIFSENVQRYQTELAAQKKLAIEMEHAKEKFEEEQQIRFNSAINRVMKEKEVALKKAGEQLIELKHLLEKNEEKLQVLYNQKEELRYEKEQGEKKLADAVEEFTRRKTELENCILETQKSLEEKESFFAEQLENERKQAALAAEAEKMKSETDSQGSGQIISELVVERFHKRIKQLEEENVLLKDRIKSGADGEEKILFVELQQTLDEKCKECDSLRAELELLQQKPRNSQVVYKDFQKGDIVEVYYDHQYGLYMIRSSGDTLYFVHPESLVNLDIPPEETRPSATFQAQMLDKEYCQAKKANNRFKVTVGTKFYRAKVRSWTPPS